MASSPPQLTTLRVSPIPKSTYIVLGVIFIDACNQFLIFPFIPFLVRDQLHLAADHPNVPLFSGLLAASYLFGQFACSPFYGALSERLGRRPVLLICVVISTIFLIAFGFSESYILSVVLRLLQGAFAGALTVGKLYLADISDATNEGKVFSYIGIAIGSGCITGPAIGGYLADPALLHPLFPKATAVGGVIRAYPYLAPCAAGALVSIVLFFVALFKLTESRPPTVPLFKSKARNGSAGRLSHKASPTASPGPLGAPLLPNAQQGASAGCGATMPVRSQSMFEAGRSNGSNNQLGRNSNSYGSNGSLSRNSSSVLLEAMTSHASRTSLVVYDEENATGELREEEEEVADLENGRGGGETQSVSAPTKMRKNGNGGVDGAATVQITRSGASSPSHSSPSGSFSKSPKPVSAVGLALKYSLSPKAQRLPLFGSSDSLQGLGSGSAGRASPAAASPLPTGASGIRVMTTPSAGSEGPSKPLTEERQKAVFWLIQASCLLFALTNVGLTEVLPVWLSTPPDATGMHPSAGGLGLSPSLIGNLQSTTGVGNIVLALFITFRIIRAIGPVNTFCISLFVNALAAFGPPLIMTFPDGCPEPIALGLMCAAYSLVAASRNMMFATAIMLSKEAAAGAPGVAIGINQSACSLGSALGPMVTGFVYTQSLAQLQTCVPFFLCVGILGAIPGIMMKVQAPPWPWS